MALGPATYDFEIRAAVQADLPRILEIWREGAADAAGARLDAGHSTIHQELISARVLRPSEVNRCWVAERADGQVVGWQSLTPRSNPINYYSIVESSTYVIRRSGCPDVGRRLLLHSLDFARQGNIEYVYGFCTAENRASKRMMRALKFQFVGSVPRSQKQPERQQLEFWVYVVSGS